MSVVTVQNRYSLGDRRHEETLAYCEKKGIGFLPWYPIDAGKMLKPDHRLAQTLAETGRRHSATPAQISLAWLLQRSPVILPIPGTSKVEHLEENVAAAGLKFSKEEFVALALAGGAK